MQVQRWRNMLLLKTTVLSPSTTITHFSSIHSTPVFFEKWKNKGSAASDAPKVQPSSKTYIRYATRQKRADSKRALKDLLFKSGCSKLPFQNEDSIRKFDGPRSWDTEQSNSSYKKTRPKVSARQSRKAHQERMKRQFTSFEAFDDSETTFEAMFGNRCYTWSFRSCKDPPFHSSASGFEWRNDRSEEWNHTSKSEPERSVGSSSDRAILGLPPRGPLKIEDVKNAFRLSALKWHPDKNQGPSQAMAEEKFKVCVSSYNALCSVLTS